jgi:hypothetical protein
MRWDNIHDPYIMHNIHTTPFTSVLLPCNQPEINTASTTDDEIWSEAKSAFLRLLRGCSFERFYNRGGEKERLSDNPKNGSLFSSSFRALSDEAVFTTIA